MELALNKQQDTHKWDSLGKFASGICALHCGLCAFLPSLFVVLGLDILLDHEAEWAFTVVAIVFALGAMAVGWSKHRTPVIAGLFSLGIVGLLGSRFLEEAGSHELGVAVGLASGICLVISHFKNASASKACEAPCCDAPPAG